MMFCFHEKFQYTINIWLNIFLKQEVFQSNVNRPLDDNGYVLNSFECWGRGCTEVQVQQIGTFLGGPVQWGPSWKSLNMSAWDWDLVWGPPSPVNRMTNRQRGLKHYFAALRWRAINIPWLLERFHVAKSYSVRLIVWPGRTCSLQGQPGVPTPLSLAMYVDRYPEEGSLPLSASLHVDSPPVSTAKMPKWKLVLIANFLTTTGICELMPETVIILENGWLL